MKMKCSLCGAVLSIDSSDAKKTLMAAKSRGWKKLTATGQPACGYCVRNHRKQVSRSDANPEVDVGGDEPQPAAEKRCSNCLHYSHDDFCSGFRVCDKWKPNQKAEGSEYWPTWDDMHRKRYGEFFQ
jgi:hypothetical protein